MNGFVNSHTISAAEPGDDIAGWDGSDRAAAGHEGVDVDERSGSGRA